MQDRIASIAQFKGSDLTVDLTQLDNGAFAYAINMILDRDGTPDKRTGYVKVFKRPLGG